MGVMSVSVVSPAPWGAPSDLGRAQSLGLATLVILTHLALGLAWWQLTPEQKDAGEASPIVVTLVQPDAPAPAVATPPAEVQPRREPTPTPPLPTRTPRPTVPNPAPVLTSQAAGEAAVAAAPVEPTPPAPAAQVAPAAPVVPVAPAAPPAPPREVSESAVSYLVKPVLVFPRISRELGESGTVMLRVLVDEQGRPSEIQVARSSGYQRLDQQAMQAMRAARFKPHLEGGVPRPVWVRTPQTFHLEDN